MADGEDVSDRSLDFVARCARSLAVNESVDDALEALLQAAIDFTDASAGAVFLLDDDRRELILTVGVDVPAPSESAPDDSFIVSLDGGDAVARAVEGDVTIIVDGGQAPDGSQGPDGDADRTVRLLELTGARACILTPLSVIKDGVDRPVGALGVCWPERVPEADALLALAAVGDFAAVAIDRARANSARLERSEWQERLAHTDPLTGLANRRTLERMLELELARAARQGGEVSVALFDVDAFAELSGGGGRPAGEAILRTVASILAESVRLVDTVGRYGASEFIVVAPGSAGTVVARRVLEAVAALGEVAGRRVTVSAGVASFPGDAATSDELLDAAREALVVARTAGGGTVGTAGPSAGA